MRSPVAAASIFNNMRAFYINDLTTNPDIDIYRRERIIGSQMVEEHLQLQAARSGPGLRGRRRTPVGARSSRPPSRKAYVKLQSRRMLPVSTKQGKYREFLVSLTIPQADTARLTETPAMQVSLETLSGLERRMTVRVPADRLQEEFDGRLRRTARKARVPGFRPGRATLDAVRQRYGAGIRQEVVDRSEERRVG